MKLGEPIKESSSTRHSGALLNGTTVYGCLHSPPPVGTPTRESGIADALLGFPATYSVQPTPYEQRLRYANTALSLSGGLACDIDSDSEFGIAVGVLVRDSAPFDFVFDRIASLPIWQPGSKCYLDKTEPREA